VTTLDACEQTQPPARERLNHRGALIPACTRRVDTAIGRSLGSWPEERYGDTLAARSPCMDDCASITEQVQSVNRCGVA
jgi:hypothetical protein